MTCIDSFHFLSSLPAYGNMARDKKQSCLNSTTIRSIESKAVRNFLTNIYLQSLCVLDGVFLLAFFLILSFAPCHHHHWHWHHKKMIVFFSTILFKHNLPVRHSTFFFFSCVASYSYRFLPLSFPLSVTPGRKRSQATRLHYRKEYDDRRHSECKRRGY